MADNRINIVIEAKDKASSVIKGTGRSIDELDTSSRASTRGFNLLGNVGSAAFFAVRAAALAATAGLAIAGGAAVKSGGEYEQSRVAFETMLGSAEKARSLMGDIAKFAKSTPFELPEVVTGTKQLLAFGYAQEELLPNMRKIGDLASGLGVPVGQLTTIFGQVRVAGRLMGQDLLQFTNNGVPMIAALSKVMKVSQSDIRDLVEEGKVGFSDVQAALDYMTGSGSQFGGMMAKQSQTFSGVVSNLKDGFGQIARAAIGITPQGDIVKGGFFDKIKDAATGMMDALGKIDLAEVSRRMGEFAGAVGAVIGVLGQVGGLIGAAWGAVVDAFKRLMADLQPGIDWFTQNVWPALQLIGAWIGSQFKGAFDAVVQAVKDVNKVFQDMGLNINVLSLLLVPFIAVAGLVVGALLLVVGGFVGVILIIAKIIQKCAEVTSAFIEFVRTAINKGAEFASGVGRAVDQTARFFGELPGRVGAALASLWSAAAGHFNAFRDSAVRWANDTVGAIVGAFTSLPGRISSAVSSAISSAGSSVSSFLGSIKLPGHASGTPYAPGGLTLVGERGPELVNLPRGSQVTQAWKTREMSSESGGGGGVTINFNGPVDMGSQQNIDYLAQRIGATFDQSARMARMGMAA